MYKLILLTALLATPSHARFHALPKKDQLCRSGQAILVSQISGLQDEIRAQNLARSFKEVGIKCPERIWPNYSLENKEVLLNHHGTGKSWRWSGKNPDDIVEVNYEEAMRLPALRSKFAFIKKGKTPIMSLAMDMYHNIPDVMSDEADPAFSTGIHEAFHHFEQNAKGWPPITETTSRADRYPMELTPRLTRQHLIVALKEAYLHPEKRPQKLREASYWLQKYKKDSPLEAKQIESYDVIEGTAQYTELMGDAIAAAGCKASPAQLQVELRKRIPVKINGAVSVVQESYDLGVLAGVLLDELGIDWKKQAMAGTTPADLLLEGIKPPAAVPFTQTLVARVANEVEKENKRLADDIDPYINAWDSKDFVRIALPAESMQGAFGATGFADVPSLPDAMVTLKMHAQFEGSSFAVQLNQPTAAYMYNGPCAPGTVILVPRSELRQNGTAVQVQTSTINGRFEQTSYKTQNDRDWICAN